MNRSSLIVVLLGLCLPVPADAKDRCPEGRDCEARGLDRLLPRRRKAGNDVQDGEPAPPSVPRNNTPARHRRARRTDRTGSGDTPGNSSSAIDSSVPLRRTQRRPRSRDVPDPAAPDRAEPRYLQAAVHFDYFDAAVPDEEDVTGPWLEADLDGTTDGLSLYPPLDDPDFWQTGSEGVWDGHDPANIGWLPLVDDQEAVTDAAPATGTATTGSTMTDLFSSSSSSVRPTLPAPTATTTPRRKHVRPTTAPPTSTSTSSATSSTSTWGDWSSSSSSSFSSTDSDWSTADFSTTRGPTAAATLSSSTPDDNNTLFPNYYYFSSSSSTEYSTADTSSSSVVASSLVADWTSTSDLSSAAFVTDDDTTSTTFTPTSSPAEAEELSSTTLMGDSTTLFSSTGEAFSSTSSIGEEYDSSTISTSTRDFTSTTTSEGEFSSTSAVEDYTTSTTEGETDSSSTSTSLGDLDYTCSSSTVAEYSSTTSEGEYSSTSVGDYVSSSTSLEESTSTSLDDYTSSSVGDFTSTTSEPYMTSTSSELTFSSTEHFDTSTTEEEEFTTSSFASESTFSTSASSLSATATEETSSTYEGLMAEWSTETSSTAFFEATLAPPPPPLAFLPFKSMTHLTPLEALVEEPDLSLLGGAIKSNEKYPVLKKVGMTIFAPVDKAFAALPIDMRALQNPAGLMRKKGGADANFETGAAQRSMRRAAQPRNLAAAWNFPADAEDPNGPPGFGGNLNHNHNNNHGPCDPYSGAECLDELVAPPAFSAAHAATLGGKNVMDDFEKLIMFHVVKRIVPPGMIESKKTLLLRTEMKGHNLDVEVLTRQDGSDSPQDRELVIGRQARVVEIVGCRNGFIYKIDGPLFPAWNPGAPNLLEAIRSNPQFSRLRFLMDKSGMFDRWALAGPVTMLLIPDNAWRIDGLQVPPCFFKALVRPENAETLGKLLRWTTIPGLWTRRDVEAVEWLPNGAAPSLSVTTIDMQVWRDAQQRRETEFAQRHHRVDPELKWGVSDGSTGSERRNDEPAMMAADGLDESPGVAVSQPVPLEIDGRVTLIEGKEVTQWDLRFYNGFGHTVAELPLRPDLDMRGMLWDCMDMFCHECPIVTKFLLKYLDGGGLLPDVTNPKAYIVPPGVRPDWMCRGTRTWFPPGWEPQEWFKYVEIAKTGNTKLAHQLALAGWRAAAGRNELLEDKLSEAEVHLRQIWRRYANPSEYVLGVKEDPNLLIGWLRNKRSLEYKPRICDPKPPKRPGVLIDTDDPWEGGEEWGHNMVSPARENFYVAVNRDRQRRFGMDDLRYVTQWM